ncbi:TPA: hypothetical protein HA317_04525 [Candidatus Woesearchaeota archaeon]|nr:hypothetical protein [Candidatus Woesearchaeota archaeon]
MPAIRSAAAGFGAVIDSLFRRRAGQRGSSRAKNSSPISLNVRLAGYIKTRVVSFIVNKLSEEVYGEPAQCFGLICIPREQIEERELSRELSLEQMLITELVPSTTTFSGLPSYNRHNLEGAIEYSQDSGLVPVGLWHTANLEKSCFEWDTGFYSWAFRDSRMARLGTGNLFLQGLSMLFSNASLLCESKYNRQGDIYYGRGSGVDAHAPFRFNFVMDGLPLLDYYSLIRAIANGFDFGSRRIGNQVEGVIDRIVEELRINFGNLVIEAQSQEDSSTYTPSDSEVVYHDEQQTTQPECEDAVVEPVTEKVAEEVVAEEQYGTSEARSAGMEATALDLFINTYGLVNKPLTGFMRAYYQGLEAENACELYEVARIIAGDYVKADGRRAWLWGDRVSELERICGSSRFSDHADHEELIMLLDMAAASSYLRYAHREAASRLQSLADSYLAMHEDDGLGMAMKIMVEIVDGRDKDYWKWEKRADTISTVLGNLTIEKLSSYDRIMLRRAAVHASSKGMYNKRIGHLFGVED